MSFTQISLYQSCPLCYKLQYIDGLKPKDKWYFSFGTTLHACVERFFKVSTPPPPSLEELLGFYEQNWIPHAYESPEEEARYKDYGKEILTRFWEIHSADFRMPVALERSFYLDIDGIKLRGFIDRVDKMDSGGLSVIDYKTNKELFTADYLADDLQLTIYQMAAEQTWQLPVERLTLYHLRSNTACSCPPRERGQLDRARRLVLDVAENITQGKFPATENQYCPCDFPEHCPYYRHQYLAVAPQPARQDLMPGIAAIDAVERYAALQAQIKELEKQLEEAKQTIIEYCQAEGLNRVFGSEYEITYKIMERTGFSEDEVRAIMEPEGLWEKVLGLDQSRLKQLLADESTADDIRNKIESLRRVTSAYPQLWLKKRTKEEE
ncbi:MAG TPA: PD-(D/E)XK nuclease family protein [Dehalococcoidales bacterium]|nr:PD-(D/E)XK nuclease family protein [Dehalococcoidales bacterium]